MASESKRRRLLPGDVLADSVRPRPSAEELAELIQRVNPSGHALPAAEERQRYRVKASLQSLLLRRHPELVVVQSEDGELLEISLVGTGRHAAHVPLEELDDDVRAWARRALVDRDDPRTATTSTRATTRGGSEDPLARAREARDRGAFDEALAFFETALAQASGRAARIVVVAELSDLFVGSLWDDAGALELAHRIRHEPEVLAHPSVRAPLALAAARAGDRARARALLLDATGAHASAAWAELGMAALGEKNVDDARRALERLAALEPMHPTVSELRTALDAIARDEAALAENELVQKVAAADDETKEALAREHARRWPKSAAARALIAEADAARRSRRITTLLERVAAAAEPSERLAAMRAARSEGAALLDEEISSLERAVEADRRTRARDELAHALSGSDPERALEAWLDADAHVRADLTLTPVLSRAASLASGPTRRTRDTARAALACARAEGHEAAGELDDAARALELGGRAAAELAELSGLSKRLELARAKERDVAAQAAIDAAEAALAAGEEERAQTLLGVHARGTGRELAERIARARLHRVEVARFETARASGDLPGARFLALALARRDAPRWRAEIERIDAETAGFFGLEWGEDPVSFADHADRIAHTQERLVSPDGRELALVSGAAQHVFLRIVDIERGVVVRHAHLRDPRGDHEGHITHAVFDGDRIRWATDSATVFSLHTSLREELVATSLSPLVEREHLLEDVLAVAGGEAAWMVVRPQRSMEQRAVVVDLEHGAVIREVAGAITLRQAESEAGPRVILQTGDAAMVHDARGQRVGGVRLSGGRIALESDVCGERLHVLYEQREAGAEELALRWSVTSDVKADHRWCGILGADPEAPSTVVAVGNAVGIVSFGDDYGWRVAACEVQPGPLEKAPSAVEDVVKAWRALDPEDPTADEGRTRLRRECMGHQGFVVKWDVPSARQVLLATSLRGESPVAVTFEPAPRVTRLSLRDAPQLAAGDEDLTALWTYWSVGERPKLPGEAAERSLFGRHLVLGPDDAWSEEHYSPAHVLAFLDVHDTGAKQVLPKLREAAARHPRSASVVAELVKLSMREDAFLEARPWIDALLALGPPAELASWAERTRGICALRCGDVTVALASWRASMERGDLDPITEDALERAEAAYEGTGVGRLQALLDAMNCSDACRARGDEAAAIAALDTAAVWTEREGHALARLADLWLARTPQSAGERFAKARALAAFAREPLPLLKFPPRTDVWDRERIHEVRRRATESLASPGVSPGVRGDIP